MGTAPSRTDRVLAALGLTIARRRGRRAWAPCPFHDPKGEWSTTTFFVRTSGERAGNYHCFSCKVKGGLAALVAHVRGLSFEDASAYVEDAGKGWRAPEKRVRFVSPPSALVRTGFSFPSEVICEPLGSWDTLPARYAAARGITSTEVLAHGIGYAVDGPLAGRIVFPVRSLNQRSVSYSARTFVDAEPRYKTPREDERPDLDALFAAHLWPLKGQREVVVVTEGAIDALAVARVTDFPACSMGGSDVRPGHVSELASWRCVVILTDADPAGDKAATDLRSGLARYAQTRRVILPKGKDAAALALEDPDALRRALIEGLS